MKNKGILLGALVLLLSAFASAGTVSFTTSGQFKSSKTNVSQGGITFTGSSYVGAGNNQVNLGTFTATGLPPNGTTSDTFTLTITQTSPSGLPGQLVAQITGHVVLTKKHGIVSNAKVTFNSSNQVVTIAGVTYTIPSTQAIILVNANNGGTINGIIASPEPAASLMLGLASIGLLGLGVISRSRMVVT